MQGERILLFLGEMHELFPGSRFPRSELLPTVPKWKLWLKKKKKKSTHLQRCATVSWGKGPETVLSFQNGGCVDLSCCSCAELFLITTGADLEEMQASSFLLLLLLLSGHLFLHWARGLGITGQRLLSALLVQAYVAPPHSSTTQGHELAWRFCF